MTDKNEIVNVNIKDEIMNILLEDLYRKFDRQSKNNHAFDSKIGIILGFFALFFSVIITLSINKPYLLLNIVFFLASIAGLVSVLIIISAFYPLDFKDPSKIKDLYSEKYFKKMRPEIINYIIESHKEAYEKNAKNMNKKAKLCKIGLITFIISIISLFIFIIHSNMSLYQIFSKEEDVYSRSHLSVNNGLYILSESEEDNSKCDTQILSPDSDKIEQS